jgi:hypothetical protein
VWANRTSNVDLGPSDSTDYDGSLPLCIRIDVRGICDKALQLLVFQALTQLLEHKIIVCYGLEPRPGGKAAIEFYHTPTTSTV